MTSPEKNNDQSLHALSNSVGAREEAIDKTIDQAWNSLGTRIAHLTSRSPIATFTTSPLWSEAKWTSTTFMWHPKSEFPPTMGIVFENAEPGLQLFKTLAKAINHNDRFEELRISIIEGSPEGQKHGYTVHIGPEMEMLEAMATAEDIQISNATMPFFGQVNRMYPITGQPNLLAKFKDEFEKHKQFMICPVTKRADGLNWASPEIGIVKHLITFRNLSEIQEDDIDAVALAMPALITPRD